MKKKRKKKKVVAHVAVVKDVVFAAAAKKIIDQLRAENEATAVKIDRLKEGVEASNKRMAVLQELLQIYNDAVASQSLRDEAAQAKFTIHSK